MTPFAKHKHSMVIYLPTYLTLAFETKNNKIENLFFIVINDSLFWAEICHMQAYVLFKSFCVFQLNHTKWLIVWWMEDAKLPNSIIEKNRSKKQTAELHSFSWGVCLYGGTICYKTSNHLKKEIKITLILPIIDRCGWLHFGIIYQIFCFSIKF